MIARLVLENWRSHEKTEFEFTRGTNVLVGAMGSGKSSAMDAISFALFGTFPNLQQRKIKLDDMIMNKPQKKDNAKVVMAFTADGREYTVKRELTRGKGQTSAEIRIDDKLIESANQRVNDRIEDLLKIDYDLFSRAVYSEQNRIDYFLEIPKNRRREMVDELLKIDRFEAARKNLGTVVNRLNDRTEDKSSQIATQPDTSQMGTLETELASDRTGLETAKKLLAELDKEKAAADIRYKAIVQKKAAFAELDNRMKELTGQMKTFEEKLKQYGAISISESDLKIDIAKRVEERKQLKSMLELKQKREAELGKLAAFLESYEKQLNEFDEKLLNLKYDKDSPAKLKDCREQATSIKNTLDEMVSNYKSIDNRLKEIEDSMAKLREGREKCPTCDAELDTTTIGKLLGKREQEKQDGERNKEELSRKVDEFTRIRKNLETDVEALEKAVSKLEEAEWIENRKIEILKEASGAKQNASILKAQLESLKIERNEEDIEAEIKKLEEMLDYFMYKKELDKTGGELDKARTELAKLGYKEEEEKIAYDKFKKAETDEKLLMQQYKSSQELISEKERRLADLKKIRDEVEKSKREIEYLKDTIDSFEVLQKGLQDVQGKLREEFTEETNMALIDIWKRLYPYADYSNLKLAIDEAGDYILQVQRRDGGWINVEGTTSGGERSTACLALRIALSLVLTQNLSWLVLDEPTHNLDRRAIRELSVTLRDHLPKIVDQIFVITHEEELESAASGRMYRLERNKEEDEPTKIVVETG